MTPQERAEAIVTQLKKQFGVMDGLLWLEDEIAIAIEIAVLVEREACAMTAWNILPVGNEGADERTQRTVVAIRARSQT